MVTIEQIAVKGKKLNLLTKRKDGIVGKMQEIDLQHAEIIEAKTKIESEYDRLLRYQQTLANRINRINSLDNCFLSRIADEAAKKYSCASVKNPDNLNLLLAQSFLEKNEPFAIIYRDSTNTAYNTVIKKILNSVFRRWGRSARDIKQYNKKNISKIRTIDELVDVTARLDSEENPIKKVVTYFEEKSIHSIIFKLYKKQTPESMYYFTDVKNKSVIPITNAECGELYRLYFLFLLLPTLVYFHDKVMASLMADLITYAGLLSRKRGSLRLMEINNPVMIYSLETKDPQKQDLSIHYIAESASESSKSEKLFDVITAFGDKYEQSDQGEINIKKFSIK